jgi:plastocyanin
MASLAMAAAIALASCGGSTVTTILSTVGAPAGGAQVVAANLAFRPTTVDVPAGQAFSLELVNRDSAPHNISIYRDASLTVKLFGGDVVGGPGSTVYSVPALAVGAWYFRCDIHPDMQGTINAS